MDTVHESPHPILAGSGTTDCEDGARGDAKGRVKKAAGSDQRESNSKALSLQF